MVGFHEPLDIAAEKLELQDLSRNVNWTPLFKYNIPGVSSEIGYIISGLLGIAIILGAGIIFKGFGKKH